MKHMRYHLRDIVWLCDKYTTGGTRENTTTDWNYVTCEDCQDLKKRPRGKPGCWPAKMGTCPRCRKQLRLTRAGAIWSHQFAREHCFGSGAIVVGIDVARSEDKEDGK